MENEKKSNAPQGEKEQQKRNRHGKRRGYFIEPVPPTEGGAPKVTAAPAPKQEGESKKPANEQNRGRGDHRPKQGHPQGNKDQRGGNKEQRPQQAQPQKEPQKPQQPQAQKEQQKPREDTNGSDKPREGSQNRGRNRRGHNRHKGQRPAEQVEKVQDQQTAQQQAPAPKREGGNQQKKSGGQRSEERSADNRRRSSDRLTITRLPANGSIPHDDTEYEEIRFPSTSEPMLSAEPVAKETDKEENVPMVEVVGIRFKSTGKTYYFSPQGKTVHKGEYAIVETARGLEYGEVSMGNSMVKESDTVPPLRPILRVATDADKKHNRDNKAKEEDAFRICNEKILAHGLDMKLIDSQYTFDNSKLLFYFTSSGRVDFRDLVKDLASVFRTRIELRQIGIRDEAKLMGGMGMCGRPLCCTLFLSDFGQVSIKMAKEQNLSLNSAKISGICGRLMCCLRYEHETYEYEIKRTPPVDSLVRTADGNGTVTEINPLVGNVKVRLLTTPETPPKWYKREDVVMLQKKKTEQRSEHHSNEHKKGD